MSNEIRYFSMFTGVGGFELGLENAGSSTNLSRRWNENSRSSQNLQSTGNKSSNETTTFSYNQQNNYIKTYKCIGFSEIDKYANQLLANKFPSVRNYGDATKINAKELPEFDMLCGGFPCQSFSIAGKRRGFEDTRGTMFFHIARILEIKRPKIVFLENVKGLLNHNKGETFRVIIQTLSELGYDVQWMVLNSKFFGVPQNRERVFIIGNLRGESRPEILPFRCTDTEFVEEGFIHPTITEAIGRQGSSSEYMSSIELIQKSKAIYGEDGISPTLADASKLSGDFTPKLAIPVLTPNREEKRQNGRRFKEDGDESFTLTKTDIHGVMVDRLWTMGNSKPGRSCLGASRVPEVGNKDFAIRRLTPIECERLQSFPDNWTSGFSDTQRYKMMGNAVTVNVIKAIGEKLGGMRA